MGVPQFPSRFRRISHRHRMRAEEPEVTETTETPVETTEAPIETTPSSA
jgi:hypothetical protein